MMATETGISIAKERSCKVQCHVTALLSDDNPSSPAYHHKPRIAQVIKQGPHVIATLENTGVVDKQTRATSGWVKATGRQMSAKGRCYREWVGTKEIR